MFACKLCNKQYKWPADLRRHERVKHRENSEPAQITGLYPFKVQRVHPEARSEASISANPEAQRVQLKTGQEPVQVKTTALQLDDEQQVLNFPDVKQTFMVFNHPASFLLSGPSSCGKTMFVVRLLKFQSQMIDQDIDEIIWCHGMNQSYHRDIKKMFPKIQFIEGLPDCTKFDAQKKRICILDDLQNQTTGNIVANLFTKGCHHTNTTVIYIQQNLFPKNKEQRDISLNAKYMVIFKNPRDSRQIGILASQMGKYELIMEAYKKATIVPYGYLMIDVTQNAHDDLRIRSGIFPDDKDNIIYLGDP